MTDYETVVIPDVDIEEALHKVLIDNGKGPLEYLIGKTGNIYHKDRYIIGKIQDWDPDVEISKDEELSVKVKPILGYKNIFKPSKKYPNRRISK